LPEHKNDHNMLALSISEKAKEKALELMKADQLDDSYFIRISVLAGGCSGLTYKMDFDNQLKDDDEVVTDKGMKLVTDPASVLYLYGTTLDFSDGLNGKGFHFVNPNASRTCGCGESFAL